jgi:hypothetical protein
MDENEVHGKPDAPDNDDERAKIEEEEAQRAWEEGLPPKPEEDDD